MGFLQRLSTVSPTKFRADSASNYTSSFFSGDDLPYSWISSLSNAGINVSPDLAMTLSAMYCGVTTIAYDLATLPLLTYKMRPDGGQDLVRGRSADWAKGGIGDLAYMLRWAPNNYQTATEYLVSQVAQFLLRGKAYAEIVSTPQRAIAYLMPRHPDRVHPERLPSGRLRYKLVEANGQSRYVTQDEMHVVRDLTMDGFQSPSRIQYAANVLGNGLAAERAAGKFFKSGMTAAVVATYTGDMEDEDEKALHNSIARYAAGVENTFGLLLVPDDVKISNLGIEPEKAQMMLAREWTVLDVARLLRMPPHKLMAKGTTTYASQVQSAIDYVIGCLRPYAHTFEQAIQRDLILAKDTYFVKFRLQELLRGDPTAMGAYYTAAITNRWMTPSEVRQEIDMNPSEELDALSARDHQPGSSTVPAAPDASTPPPDAPKLPNESRSLFRGLLSLNDQAIRCLRRERAAVQKLAVKHASDVDGWKQGLRDFYAEHAQFVAETLRLSPAVARGYAAQHGSEFEAKGIVAIAGEAGEAWERFEATELAELALAEGDRIEGWFNRRLVDARLSAQTMISVEAPITVQTPVSIDKGAVALTVDARTSVAPAAVKVDVAPAQIDVDARTTVEPATIEVDARSTIQVPPRKTEVHISETSKQSKVKRDAKDRVAGVETVTTTTVRTKE